MTDLSREFVAVLLWGVLLLGLTLAQFAFMSETYSYGLLGGAALVTLLLGVALFVRRHPASQEGWVLPDVSYPIVAIGVGVAFTGLGFAFGLWLLLPGLGLLTLGIGALVSERRRPRA